MRPLLAAALLSSALPSAPRAAPTVDCHCFQDRTWDPAAPASADPYVLATTRSSLLSATYGVGKGSLVRAVMGGVAADDLWIAYWAGARADRDPDALLAERERKRSWKRALAGARGLGPAFEKALAAGAPDRALSALAVDDVLTARLGASGEEVVLASVLSVRLGTPAMPILARVRSGRATWGSTLHEAGLAPKDMDGVVRGLVR